MDRYRIPKARAMALWAMPEKAGQALLVKLPRAHGRPVIVPLGTALIEEPVKKCKPELAERKAWQQVRAAFDLQKVKFLAQGQEPATVVLIDLEPLESGIVHVDGQDKAYALYSYGLLALCGQLDSQFADCQVDRLPFEQA